MACSASAMVSRTGRPAEWRRWRRRGAAASFGLAERNPPSRGDGFGRRAGGQPQATRPARRRGGTLDRKESGRDVRRLTTVELMAPARLSITSRRTGSCLAWQRLLQVGHGTPHSHLAARAETVPPAALGLEASGMMATRRPSANAQSCSQMTGGRGGILPAALRAKGGFIRQRWGAASDGRRCGRRHDRSPTVEQVAQDLLRTGSSR
jgi:hypothetical protein